MAENGVTKHKRGRPSTAGSEKIKKEIKAYYDQGYSATYTAQKTGYDWKTVQTHFKNWTEQIIDNSDFIFQQQDAKIRLVLELDKCIEIYAEQLKRVQKEIKKGSSIAKETLLAQVTRNLTSLSLDKAGVLIAPTLDIQISNILKEKYGIDLKELQEKAHATGS